MCFVALVIKVQCLGADGWRVGERPLDAVVTVVTPEVVEVRQQASIRVIEFFNDRQQPVGVVRITAVRLDHDLHLAAFRVVADRTHALDCVFHVLLTVSAGTAVYPDGITAKLYGAVHPALVFLDRAGALLGILCVQFVAGVDEDQHVFHPLTSGALGQFADVFFVGVLASERPVPVLDVRDAEFLFGQCRIVEMLEFSAAEPTVKCVFLNTDLESV